MILLNREAVREATVIVTERQNESRTVWCSGKSRNLIDFALDLAAGAKSSGGWIVNDEDALFLALHTSGGPVLFRFHRESSDDCAFLAALRTHPTFSLHVEGLIPVVVPVKITNVLSDYLAG